LPSEAYLEAIAGLGGIDPALSEVKSDESIEDCFAAFDDVFEKIDTWNDGREARRSAKLFAVR
jgi:hypothetical protein